MIRRRACAHHPDRPGHAVCMSCRKVVCQECAATWEGVHYCVGCLAARRHAGERRAAPLAWIATAAAVLLLLFLHVRLSVWAGALVARLL